MILDENVAQNIVQSKDKCCGSMSPICGGILFFSPASLPQQSASNSRVCCVILELGIIFRRAGRW